MNLEINVKGNTEEDLEITLEEILKQIKDGFTSGHDANSEGSYTFYISND